MTRRARWIFALFVAVLTCWTVAGWLHLFYSPTPPVSKVLSLHGQSIAKVLADLGTPTHDYEFTLGDGASWIELRIELHNFYPPDKPESASVLIRECQWDYKDHHLAVWFHKIQGEWIVLDTCRWENGIAF